MQICGIVAEFNPFHNGHNYIINKIKAQDNCVLSVMSGNYVQRGEPALFSKFVRTEAALSSGVDLVIELPSPWSCSCAQNFSFGAISLMKECGVTSLAFGSEIGDIGKLKKIAEKDLSLKVDSSMLKSGKTYAKIRQEILTDSLGSDFSKVLQGANNNLGIEYIKSCELLNYKPDFITIKRFGAEHDSATANKDIASATYIRDSVFNCSFNETYVPQTAAKLYNDCIESGLYINHESVEKAIITHLRRIDSFNNLPDISEGLDNKIKNEIRNSGNYKDLLDNIKCKRYTLSRIRRILLSAFLDINNSYFLKPVPYINVLGFTKLGEKALKHISATTKLPIIISCKANKALDKNTEILLNNECKRNNIYMSLLNNPQPCGTDFTNGIIKKG